MMVMMTVTVMVMKSMAQVWYRLSGDPAHAWDTFARIWPPMDLYSANSAVHSRPLHKSPKTRRIFATNESLYCPFAGFLKVMSLQTLILQFCNLVISVHCIQRTNLM